MMPALVGTVLLVLSGLLTFHPARPLYTRNRDIPVVSRDGTHLSATLSLPRWERSEVPAVVLVHGSGRLSREHVRGDMRRLVRAGIGVIPYDSRTPRFQIILSGAAVSTGEEGYYSMMTGDGTRPPQVTNDAEIADRTRAFSGDAGFDPRPLLAATRVPTLWLLGELDRSVPTFRTAEVLDSLKREGNPAHSVITYPRVGHDLRSVDTGDAVPIWPDVFAWLESIAVTKRD